MKTIILTLIFMLTCQTFAQDTNIVKYLPLKVGNVWVYNLNTYSRAKISVTGTVMSNNHLYYIISQQGYVFPCVPAGQCMSPILDSLKPIRIDSVSGNIMRLGTSCQSYVNENVLDSLKIRIGATPNYVCINTACTDTSFQNILGTQRKVKYMVNNFPPPYGYARKYAYGIGIVNSFQNCEFNYSCNYSLLGCVIDGVVYGDTSTYFSISGQIQYQDNNQPVNSGFVKALKYDRVSNQIITVDSASIQSGGTYSLVHIHQDSIYIMAFENDETQLSFVPTYYPSSTTWQNASVLFPTGNLSNINVLVYRINNSGGQFNIGGHIYINAETPLNGLSNAIVYAKVGNNYKGYSVSSSSGLYQVDSLSTGSYDLIVDRIGYYSVTRATGITNYSKDTIDIAMNTVNGIQIVGMSLPKEYRLESNYPNPFNPATKIGFSIPNDSKVKIIIYDMLGREVEVLVNEELKAGNYSVDWNASSFASGVYFYRLEARQPGSSSEVFIQTRKMALIK